MESKTTHETTAEKPWETLTPEEKLERRLAAWLSPPGVKFDSPEAEAAYKERVTNIIDAIQIKRIPARIPILPSFRGFGEAYCGYTHHDIMYDVEKAINVMTKCTLDFQLDTKAEAAVQQGKVYDILDDKTHIWPGHGLPLDADGLQYVENEYMKADEYDAFFDDPSDYQMRTHLPRTWGAVAGLTRLSSLAEANISRFGQPEVQAALMKLMEAGREALPWQQKMDAANRRLTEQGFPSLYGRGGGAGPPFSRFGDSLRGTHGIMMDMFRQPEKLIESMERLVPVHIKRAAAAARLGTSPIVDFHLHKGFDSIMSDEKFRTFYWGPVRKIILGIIEEGLLLHLRLEGSFNSRLETMSELPKGKTIWWLSHETDTARAKEIAGDVACIAGNVPAGLIHTGTTEEIATYCRNLIKVAGKGGGYMFAMPQEGIHRNTKAENVWAMINTAKQYGAYS